MENWGLITYRETALLYDPSFSSNSNKERVATIIAHELAHMVRLGLSSSGDTCLTFVKVVVEAPPDGHRSSL